MRRSRAKGAACVAAFCAMAIAVGCGGDDDDVNNTAENYDGTEAEVARVVDDFANAARDGDSTMICEDIFSTELADNIERESGQSCPSEVEDNLPDDDYELEIDSLELNDDDSAAAAAVTDQDDASFLVHVERTDSDWRIARLANNNAARYSGTEAEVATLVDDFANAGWAGDGAQICQMVFTAELAKNIENQAGQSCASEVEDNLPKGEYELVIDSLGLNDDENGATVAVTDQDDNSSVLHIEKVDDAWRIARVTPAQ